MAGRVSAHYETQRPETLIVNDSPEGRGGHSRGLEVLLLALAFVLVNVVSSFFQEPTALRGGRGADGFTYSKVAKQLFRGDRPTGKAPFVYRVGTPYLVSIAMRSGLGVVPAFKVVNLAANALSLLLFIVWLRLYLADWRIRTLLALLFVTQWHAPIRSLHFYPTLVDPWSHVFILAGLIGIHKVRNTPSWTAIGVISAIVFVGTLVREIVLLIPLSLLFARNPVAFDSLSPVRFRITNLPRLSFFLPVVVGISALVLVRSLASQVNDYSFLEQAMRFADTKSLLTYALGWFLAFGPLLVLAVFNWRRGLSLLSSHQFLFVFLACIAVSSWVGGTNTERILYWAMPVVYLLIGRAIEDHAEVFRSAPLIAVLSLSQAVSQRLFWTTPDFGPSGRVIPVLTPMSGEASHSDLLSFYGPQWIHAISLAEYLFLAALLIVWMQRRARAARKPGPDDELVGCSAR